MFLGVSTAKLSGKIVSLYGRTVGSQFQLLWAYSNFPFLLETHLASCMSVVICPVDLICQPNWHKVAFLDIKLITTSMERQTYLGVDTRESQYLP